MVNDPPILDVSSSLRILTLGDGDFTYSLDLVSYFSSSTATNTTLDHRDDVGVTATSFDSLAALRNKYKDVDFFLNKLRSYSVSDDKTTTHNNKKQRRINEQRQLCVTICHNVNAIVGLPSCQTNSDDTSNNTSAAPLPSLLTSTGYDHVIFNHPHLGQEDAKLHSMFMSHLFHSCQTTWLNNKPHGCLHLTLVHGQCERWDVISRAIAHGLKLLRRESFIPPPPATTTTTTTTTYILRRHQSGKSFSKRTRGSETLTFGREQVWNKITTTTANHSAMILPTFELPWFQSSTAPSISIPTTKTIQFNCPNCSRIFAEKRSLDSHVKAIHLDGSGNPVLVTVVNSYDCKVCQDRSFPSKSALDDHVRARHTLHVDIKPDWCALKRKCINNNSNNNNELLLNNSNKNNNNNELLLLHNKSPNQLLGEEEEEVLCCDVCKVTYSENFGPMDHYRQLQPVKEESEPSFQCQNCGKRFWENRAQLQHENNCITSKLK